MKERKGEGGEGGREVYQFECLEGDSISIGIDLR